MSMLKKLSCVTSAIVLTLVGIQGCSKSDETQDANITQTIVSKISSETQIPPEMIAVETQEGVVILSGSVSTVDEEKKLISIAESVQGVKKVESSNLIVTSIAPEKSATGAAPQTNTTTSTTTTTSTGQTGTVAPAATPTAPTTSTSTSSTVAPTTTVTPAVQGTGTGTQNGTTTGTVQTQTPIPTTVDQQMQNNPSATMPTTSGSGTTSTPNGTNTAPGMQPQPGTTPDQSGQNTGINNSNNTGTNNGANTGTNNGASPMGGSSTNPMGTGTSSSQSGASSAVQPNIEDISLNARVRSLLMADPASRNVTVNSRSGTVTLTGTVNSQADSDAIVRKVQGIDGVKKVDFQMAIQNGDSTGAGNATSTVAPTSSPVTPTSTGSAGSMNSYSTDASSTPTSSTQ